MKVVLDTSVWIEHLRHAVLDSVLPLLRGRRQLYIDSVVVGELFAGCRSIREREAVEELVAPFRRAERIAHSVPADVERGGKALSRLRERGRTLRRPAGALLDALMAATASRMGATLVSLNTGDFEMLAQVMPLAFETFPAFRRRMQSQT